MSKLQHSDGRFRPSPSSTNPLYSSYDLQKSQQFSPTEDDKLLQLKRENYELMRSLGLNSPEENSGREKESNPRFSHPNQQQEQESFMSPVRTTDYTFPRYTNGTNDSTQRTSVPQMSDVSEYYNKKVNLKTPLSLDLKKLLSQEGLSKKQSLFSTGYTPMLPDSAEDSGDSEVQYFQYTDFDDFVTAMAKPLRQADVRSKVMELKNLAHSMKSITENPTEKNVNAILKRFGEHSVVQKKPLYQQLLEKDPSNQKNMEKSYQSPPKNKSPKGKNDPASKPGVLIKGPTYNDVSYEKKAAAPHNSNYSSSKQSEKNESFEAFLYDQGVAPSLFNQNVQNLSPEKQEKNLHIPILEHQGTGEFPDLLDVKAVAAFLEGAGAHVHSSDLMSSLQFFLLQNLKEISQIKDLLKNEESMSPIARAFNKNKMRSKSRKSVDKGVSMNLPLDDDEDEELEKKLKEAQTDRLIKKLQASNKRIQELEKENESYKEMEQTLIRCFKAGKVQVSYVRFDLDTSQVTLEDLNNDFEFESRFLVVTPNAISFEPLRAEDEEELDSRSQEPLNEIPLNNIDYVSYLEKPGSNVFFIRMSDSSREKPKGQDPKRINTTIKSGFAENKPVIYIIQIENQKEVYAWELAFFITNFRILAKNVQFSYIRREFMQSIKLFLNKYIEFNGDNTLIFGDGSSQAGGKPPLHPLATFGNIKQSTLEILPDVIQESSRNQTPAMITIAQKVQELMKPKHEQIETKQNTSVQLNRQIIKNMKALPQKKSSPFDEDAGDSDEVRSNISQITPDVASFEEGVTTEDNKSSRSIRSNNGFKKRAGAEISETFSKYLTFLLEGVALEKFGKWGTRKEKLVRISNDFTGLEWVDPMKPNKVPDFIMIESITRIELANRSAFFQKRSLQEPELSLCFTIVSNEKNLNLKAPDPKRRDNFIEALQFVLSDKPKLKKMTTISQTIKAKAH